LATFVIAALPRLSRRHLWDVLYRLQSALCCRL